MRVDGAHAEAPGDSTLHVLRAPALSIPQQACPSESEVGPEQHEDRQRDEHSGLVVCRGFGVGSDDALTGAEYATDRPFHLGDGPLVKQRTDLQDRYTRFRLAHLVSDIGHPGSAR